MELEAAWGLFSVGTVVREPDRGRVSLETQEVSASSLCETRVLIAACHQYNNGMLPECEFGFEHSLSLQSSALTDEQVVVVSLERRFVNIEHFVPQVEGHAAAGKKAFKSTESTERVLLSV